MTDAQAGTLMIEWAMANCDAGKIPAIHVAIAAMVINGSPKEEMDLYREHLRKGVKDNYPDTAAACADFMARIEAAK